MTFLDGPAQIVLIVLVFCCPIIPAGGWCWLKAIQGCLNGLSWTVRKVRHHAFIPMYFVLLFLFATGLYQSLSDVFEAARTKEQMWSFWMFVTTSATAFLSIIISIHSTVKCVSTIRRNGDADNRERASRVSDADQLERTVYIIALPGFYGLMCFLSAEQLLMYKLGTLGNHWAWNDQFKAEKGEEFVLDMLDFYMSVADVFEAFAFSFFGTLTMESMRRAGIQRLGPGNREEALQGCIQRWTMSPLYIFCLVLCVEASYHLVQVFGHYFGLYSIIPPALSDFTKTIPQPNDDFMTAAFFTLTSVFSSLAILALISVESVFHDDLAAVGFVGNGQFSQRYKMFANLKFWGVKIFVSVEFCLQLIMMVVSMDKIHVKLLYTLCMAVLCFLVSIVHICAYSPKGKWICLEAEGDPERSSQASGTSLQQLQLRDGALGSQREVRASLLEEGNYEAAWRKHQPKGPVSESTIDVDEPPHSVAPSSSWEPPMLPCPPEPQSEPSVDNGETRTSDVGEKISDGDDKSSTSGA